MTVYGVDLLWFQGALSVGAPIVPSMDAEDDFLPLIDTHGTAPLITLVGSAEEHARRLAEHLEELGILAQSPEAAALLTSIRVKLLVAKSRLR